MTSYLARLALRSLGHPVDARLMPGLDSQVAFARDDYPADARASEVATEAPLSPRDERDARDHATAAEPPQASVRRAPLPDVVPLAHSPNAPVAEARKQGGHVLSPPTATAIEMPPGPAAVVDEVQESRADSPASEPRETIPSVARARSSLLGLREAHANRAPSHGQPTRSVANAIGRRRDGVVRRLEASEPGTRERSATVSADATLERRAATDAPESPRALTQSGALSQASVQTEPAAISVEIGRIEVRIAPPPPAPASRPRAAPEGFDGYWRLRNYLDRLR